MSTHKLSLIELDIEREKELLIKNNKLVFWAALLAALVASVLGYLIHSVFWIFAIFFFVITYLAPFNFKGQKSKPKGLTL